MLSLVLLRATGLIVGLIKTIFVDGFGIGMTYLFGVFLLAVILLAVIMPYLSSYIDKRKSNTIFD